ncbi:MAG: tetratricopeptide repeat protein [Ignavibacteriae bacterium]|nr:MAG: tetratricopeptide repeat protein [Ignavibacteriota bacterium]
MKKTAIFLLLILSFAVSSYSQSRDELMNKGIDYVYKVQFDSAQAIFQNLVNQNPKDPTGYFMLSMNEWWKIYLNKNDESHDEAYRKAVDKTIEVCDEKLDANENDEWALFLKGGVIGYRGFLNALRDNWLNAVDDGKAGLHLLQRCNEINPNNKDAILGMGIYNYAVEYVTDKFPFLKAVLFLFPKGNKELGLSQLKDCMENSKFAKIEANVALCYINLAYEKNYYEAERHALRFFNLYPDNPVAEKFLGRSYAGLAKWNESLTTWKSILNKIDSNKAGYDKTALKRESFYYLGLSNLRVNNPDEALNYYRQSADLSRQIEKDKETPELVFSILGIGMAYDMKGDRNEAIKYYDQVLNMKEIENSRQLAQSFKNNPYK